MSNKHSGKLWLYFDAGFTEDAKIIAAGERAGWLFVSMMCAAKRNDTDGVLTAGQIAKLSIPSWRKRLDDLIGADLVVELPMTPGHYAIANWTDWQETREERDERRAKWRDNKKKGPDHAK